MQSRFIRGLKGLELEEQILNASAVIALIGTLLPWVSGEWFGELDRTHTAFGFYTSFLGLSIFLLLLSILLLTLVPLAGGPVLIPKRFREYLRLFAALQAMILTFAVLSVLTRFTFQYTRMEVRFGIFITLIGCAVTCLYSFLRLQEYRRSLGQELFHHPDDDPIPLQRREVMSPPPPPPPPPPPAVEEHPLYP
ncbi:MAG: hypothetical protein Greene041619_1075 [Candidatus Peregrinibacteria bacterium Greene0416_19]|nr:MAG: hypothetical protein Greene041619_1075 [Candidatus Peregrinibacteria bacterium Greene0416_19]